MSPINVSCAGKLRPSRLPSQEREESQHGSRGAPRPLGGTVGTGLPHPARAALTAGGLCRQCPSDPAPSGAWSLRRPLPTAQRRRGHPCARYPDGETEAWREAVLFARSRRGVERQVPRVPPGPQRCAEPQHPSPGVAAQRRSTSTSRRRGRHSPAARDRPTLMTAAQVAAAAAASGSGSELLAARRVPAPSAAASSHPQPSGRGRWEGPGPSTSPARESARPPFLPRPLGRVPGTPELVSGRAFAQRKGSHSGAHTPQRMGRAPRGPSRGWGCLPSHPVAFSRSGMRQGIRSFREGHFTLRWSGNKPCLLQSCLRIGSDDLIYRRSNVRTQRRPQE